MLVAIRVDDIHTALPLLEHELHNFQELLLRLDGICVSAAGDDKIRH